MADILVRGVSEETIDALKRRAERNRRSLQKELLSVIETAAKGPEARSPSEVADAIRMTLGQGNRTFGDTVELLREDRER